MFYKKFILLILLIFLFICCDNQNLNQNEEITVNRNTKSTEEILISKPESESQKVIPQVEKKLIRKFENDFSEWELPNGQKIYKDLRYNLEGDFKTFGELRTTQYRTRGIITDFNEVQKIVNSGKPTILEGWSETCIYCKMSEVVLNDLKTEYKEKVNFVTIDVANRYLEDVTQTVKFYNIIATPTYIILDKNGEEVYRSVGYSANKDILSDMLSDLN